MANDIVKEILLKFKSDSKDVNRDVDKLSTSLKGIEKVMGGQQGQSSAKLFKSFKDFGDNAKKMGASLSADFARVQKVIQTVATKDLNDLGRKVDQMATKAEQRLKKLNEMERTASPHQLRRQEQLVRATNNRMSRMMSQYDVGVSAMGVGGGGSGGGGGPGGFGGLIGGPLGSFFTGAAIGRGVTNVANAPVNLMQFAKGLDQRMLTNPAIANQAAIEQRLASYRGDMTMGVLARKGVSQRAQEYAERQSKLSRGIDYGNLLFGGLQALGGGALMAAGAGVAAGGTALSLGSLTVPAALAGGAMISAGAVIGGTGLGRAKAGGSGVIDRLFANKTEAEKSRAYQDAVEAEKSRLIDDDLYRAFYEKAPERAQFRRRFGVSEDVMADTRQVALRSMMTPEEQMAIASNLRSTVGSGAAMSMSLGVGRQSLRQGMDAGITSQIMSTLATGGKGGTKGAEKAMEELFTRAVSAGFTDTGIREELMKMTGELVNSSTSRTDSAAVLERLMTYLPKGATGEDFKREMEGAKAAQAMDESRFSGKAPIDEAINKQVAIRNLRKMGRKVDMVSIEQIEGLTMQDLETGSEKTKALGLSDQNRKDILRDREEAMASVNPDEAKAMGEIKAKIARGEKVSDDDLFKLGSTMISSDEGAAGLRNATPEAIRARARARVTRADSKAAFQTSGAATGKTPQQMAEDTKAYDKERKDQANDSAIDTQTQEIFRGKAKEEQDISSQMTPTVTKEVARAQREANKAVENAGSEADPKTSAANAATAMNNFSTALDNLTKKLNVMGSASGFKAGSSRPGP